MEDVVGLGCSFSCAHDSCVLNTGKLCCRQGLPREVKETSREIGYVQFCAQTGKPPPSHAGPVQDFKLRHLTASITFFHFGTSVQSSHWQHEAGLLLWGPVVRRNKPGICLRQRHPVLQFAPHEEEHPIETEARRNQTAAVGENPSR